MDNNYLVKKSNYFIMNGSFDLSLEEQKIILTLASMVHPDDEEFKPYKFKISDFLNLVGVKDQSKYTKTPKITKELMKKVLEIEEGNKIIQVAWLSSAVYEKGKGYVELEFSPRLKPYMLKLNEMFTRYRLVNILNMKSKYSPRVYEILKANEFKKQGYIEIEISELRKILKAEKIYPRYYDFKNRILLPTKIELKRETDISFNFEEIRYGREVKSIKFYIKANNPTNNKPVDILPLRESRGNVSEKKPSESKLDPIKRMLEENISDKQLESLYKASNGNLSVISEKYEISKMQKTPINNIVGWLIKAIENDYKSDPKMKINESKKDFIEREYDYDDLERKLLGWDKL